MKGWFDAFRTDGGPTLYHHSNRTAVAGDISTITILIIFITVFIAFLLIFPGVRSQVSDVRRQAVCACLCVHCVYMSVSFGSA